MLRVGVLACVATVCVGRLSRADDVEDVSVRGSRANGFTATAKERDAPREITDVASLIDGLPGVHVRRLGAEDGFATLSIRGTASTQANVMLAGIPLSGGADPSVDLSSLPLWPGARARVFRSFAPAALGQGSLGGTLSLDPALAKDATGAEVWSALGSFGAARLRAGDVFDVGRARVACGLSASRADDDYSYANPDHAPPKLDPRETVVRRNAGHADANGLVSVSIPIAFGGHKQGYWRALGLLQAREQHLPGTLRVGTPLQRLASDREVLGAELGVPMGPGAGFARAWGRREGRSLTDDPIDRPYDATRSDSAIFATGASVGWRGRPGKTIRVLAVVDARAERFAPGVYVGPSPASGATRVAVGAGADVDFSPHKTLTLAASGRVDVWHDASVDPSIIATSDARPSAHAGIEWTLGRVQIDAHGGATARPPNFSERFGSSGGSIPTPDLRTESAWTVDVGAHTLAVSGPFRGSFELVGFGMWARDLITFVPVSVRSVPKAENIDEARILGIEASADAKLFGARLRVSYTGLSTINFAACAQGSCPPLPGRPAHDLALDASYTRGPATLRYGLDALAGMRADVVGYIEIPARVLQSVGARLEVTRGVTVAIDLRNLFDVRTASYAQAFNGSVVQYPIGDAYAYPLPGRSFLASLRVRSD